MYQALNLERPRNVKIPSERTVYRVNDDVAAIDFMTGDVLEGHLPPKALAMVREWVGINKESLQEIWETQEFRKLPPLE